MLGIALDLDIHARRTGNMTAADSQNNRLEKRISKVSFVGRRNSCLQKLSDNFRRLFYADSAEQVRVLRQGIF